MLRSLITNFTKSSNSMWKVGQKVTYTRKRSVTFTAPIFTKHTDTLYIYMVISQTKCYKENYL